MPRRVGNADEFREFAAANAAMWELIEVNRSLFATDQNSHTGDLAEAAFQSALDRTLSAKSDENIVRGLLAALLTLVDKSTLDKWVEDRTSALNQAIAQTDSGGQ